MQLLRRIRRRRRRRWDVFDPRSIKGDNSSSFKSYCRSSGWNEEQLLEWITVTSTVSDDDAAVPPDAARHSAPPSASAHTSNIFVLVAGQKKKMPLFSAASPPVRRREWTCNVRQTPREIGKEKKEGRGRVVCFGIKQKIIVFFFF